MKKAEAVPIGTAIGSLLKELGIGRKVREYGVVEEWPRIVGDQIARVTEAVRIDGGKLIVRVSNSTWRQELVFLKSILIEKINHAMNEDVVNDIMFR